ncbi:MAG: hypothetical protein Q9182_000599 [Xanthomendoza sp. 2 TL-2023]
MPYYYDDRVTYSEPVYYDYYGVGRRRGGRRHAGFSSSEGLPPTICSAGVWGGQCLNPDHRMPPGAVRNGEPLGPLHQIAIEEGICLTHIPGGCYENGDCEEMQDWSVSEVNYEQGYTGDMDGRQALRIAVGLPPGPARSAPPPGVRNAVTGEVGPLAQQEADGPRARGQAYRGGISGGHRQRMITGGRSEGHRQRRRCGAAYQVEEDEDEMEGPADTMGRGFHQVDHGEPTRSRHLAEGYEEQEEEDEEDETDDPTATTERHRPHGGCGGENCSHHGAGGYEEEDEEEEEEEEGEEEDELNDPTATTARLRPQGGRGRANPSRCGAGTQQGVEAEDETDERAATLRRRRLQGGHGAGVNGSDHDSGPPTGRRRVGASYGADGGVSRALVRYRNGADEPDDLMGGDRQTG